MRVALVGKFCAIEPFPLSPFPFRDGGTKPEKALIKTNPNRKRAEKAVFNDSAYSETCQCHSLYAKPPLALRDISPKGGETRRRKAYQISCPLP